MIEGHNQSNANMPTQDASDRTEEMTQSQQQAGIGDNADGSGAGFGQGGNSDLGKQQNVTGGSGVGGDQAGSAAGATGVGSGSDRGAIGGGQQQSTTGGTQQGDSEMDDEEVEFESEMGDGASAASAGGSAI